ncbi:MAG: DMT family transporter [Chthoniobacterales bacterium]
MRHRENSASRVPGSEEPDLSKGYAAIVATVAIWSTPSLFQFYLNRYYDPTAQNFYRYSLACLAVLPFVFFGRKRSSSRINIYAIGACLLPALPNVVHQITQTVALFYMGPGVYAVFTRSSVIMTALLALMLFPEERWIIRQWRFQVGTILGLLGAVGVFWFQADALGRPVALRGLAIAFIATFFWALYGVLIKRPSAELGAVRSFAVISCLTSLLLLPLTILFGNIATPLHVGLHVNIILIVSAITCISMAHVLYYIAIRELGVALSQTLQLVCPAAALALSAWFFGERLTPMQVASAAILLIGAFLAMRVTVPASSASENL